MSIDEIDEYQEPEERDHFKFDE